MSWAQSRKTFIDMLSEVPINGTVLMATMATKTSLLSTIDKTWEIELRVAEQVVVVVVVVVVAVVVVVLKVVVISEVVVVVVVEVVVVVLAVLVRTFA
jgi:hypothetical protein